MSSGTSLRIGDYIAYRQDVWRVIGMTGRSVTLRSGSDVCTVATDELLAEPGLRLVDVSGATLDEPLLDAASGITGVWSTESACGVLTVDGLNEMDQKHVLTRMHLIQRFLTGYPQGFPQSTDEEPDIVLGPVQGEATCTARMELLARELNITSRQAATLVKRFQEYGPLGLVDQRKNRHKYPLKHCPPELRKVIVQELERTKGASKATDRALMGNIRRAMKAQHPDIDIPKATAMRAYIKALSSGRPRHLSTKTQQGNDSRGKISPVRGQALRPFDRVEIDATPLDVMALFPEAGIQRRPTLLTAVDVRTRSIVAWRVIPEKEGAIDIALLLYHMMSPKIAPASWGETARWRYGVPAHLVLGSADITSGEMFAGIPAGVPTSILVDWGKANISADVRRVAKQLGITIEMARHATGSDKPHVESSFGRINEQFTAHLPGYTGASVNDRGVRARVEEEACLTVEEIEEAFGRWVATVYQNTPHSGLSVPGAPGQLLTPNEAFDIDIAYSGILPIAIDRNVAISLLPAAMRPIHHYGFEVDRVCYNSPELQQQHGIPSPFDSTKNRWPVRWDPRDRSIAWIWQPHPEQADTGTWLEVPSTTLALAGPMSQARWNNIKKIFAVGRRDSPTPEEVQNAEDDLITGLPKPGTESRIARRRAISDSKVAAAARDRAQWGDTTPHLPAWQAMAEPSEGFHDPDLYGQIGEDEDEYEDDPILTAQDDLA